MVGCSVRAGVQFSRLPGLFAGCDSCRAVWHKPLMYLSTEVADACPAECCSAAPPAEVGG